MQEEALNCSFYQQQLVKALGLSIPLKIASFFKGVCKKGPNSEWAHSARPEKKMREDTLSDFSVFCGF